MKRVLTRRGVNVFTPADLQTPRPVDDPPATPDDLQRLIKLVENRKPECKKLWIYIDAHGYRSSAGKDDGGIVLGGPAGNPAPYKWVNYTDLARSLRPMAERGVMFNVIVDACFAANVIKVMDDFGIPGIAVAAAGSSNYSHFAASGDIAGSYITQDLAPALLNPRADVNHDGTVDPEEATDWITAHSTNLTMTRSNPWAAHTSSEHPTTPYQTGNVTIAAPGRTQTITIRRPDHALDGEPLSISNGFHTFEIGDVLGMPADPTTIWAYGPNYPDNPNLLGYVLAPASSG